MISLEFLNEHAPYPECHASTIIELSPGNLAAAWGMTMSSSDAGKTWTKPLRLPDGILGPIKNKPVVLTDGGWLSPSSTAGNTDGWLVHFELSRDGGNTWRKIGPVGKGPSFDAIQSIRPCCR